MSSAAWSVLQNNYLWPLFVCHWEYAAGLLARSTRLKVSTVSLLRHGEIDGEKWCDTQGKNRGRGKATEGDWEKRDFIDWLVIHYWTECQIRQWTDIKGPQWAWGNDTAGGERKLNLLIKLSKVIALRVTRAPSSAISAFNGVCERGCDFLSVCHASTHVVTLLDFLYQHLNLSRRGLKQSSVPLSSNYNRLFFFTLPKLSKLAKLISVSHCSCFCSANKSRVTNKTLSHMTTKWLLCSVQLDNKLLDNKS